MILKLILRVYNTIIIKINKIGIGDQTSDFELTE